MGLRDKWSSGLSLTDVTVALEALEKMCRVHITISMSLENQDGLRGPWLTGCMWSRVEETTQPRLLVSQQLKCSATEYTSLDVAAFRLLYMLDGAIADFEMTRSKDR